MSAQSTERSSNPMQSVAVVIPTLNAEPHLDALLPALSMQGLSTDAYLIIDSTSTDDTVGRFRDFGAEVQIIPQAHFNHGGTRRMAAASRRNADVLIFLTQDAIPASPNAFRHLLSSFQNPDVALAYGRQLPRGNASAIERHARLFNYPNQSQLRSREDAPRLGIRTTFCSDSFAAYRHSRLLEVGSFPEDAFFAEDQVVAGRLLLAGHKIAYAAGAAVIHSHNYTIRDDFGRYFDVGVFHGRNRWLLDYFGVPEGAGAAFVKSEFRYLLRHAPGFVPEAVARTIAKYLGYRIGINESRLAPATKARLSMQPFYWTRQQRRV